MTSSSSNPNPFNREYRWYGSDPWARQQLFSRHEVSSPLIPVLSRESLATMRIAHAIRDHLMQELPIRRDVRT
jgi:hypothetical protein